MTQMDAQLSLNDIPAELAEVVQAAVATLQARGETLDGYPHILSGLPRVFAASDFVIQTCLIHNGLLLELAESGALLQGTAKNDPQYYLQKLNILCQDCVDEEALAKCLRLFRQREMVRIAWRSLLQWATLAETCADLSALADACVIYGLERLEQLFLLRYQAPLTRDGQSQQLMVVAVGKLGGAELNFSSDIDLWFCYPEDVEQEIAADVYFNQLAQALLRLLNHLTKDGFVFRVDTRLRPFGIAGPLTLSLNAVDQYFQSQGRDWERFALIKARILTGLPAHRDALTKLICQFVYRRYLDYGMLQALRELKQTMNQQLKENITASDIKRCRGGIRELEFFVQVLQLIRGGKNMQLRTTNTWIALERLKEQGVLTANKIDDLMAAYHFFRELEHALQMRADQQTYTLPIKHEQQLQILVALQLQDWQQLIGCLALHQQKVAQYFSSLMSKPQNKYAAINKNAGIVDEALVVNNPFNLQVQALQKTMRYQNLSNIAKSRVQQLLPVLLHEIQNSPFPNECFIRMCHLCEALMKRSQYLSLLFENRQTLQDVVYLSAKSNWIVEELVNCPALLAELIDVEKQLVASHTELANLLEQTLIGIPEDDHERQIETIRYFKRAHLFKTAVMELKKKTNWEQSSQTLTALAAVVLQAVLRQAFSYFAVRAQSELPNRFAIIAYGGLGSGDLIFASDLDLVFLHDQNEAEPNIVTLHNGKKWLEAEFYARIAQRIISLLATKDTHGYLYEVDTRLRPSGRSGLLVSSLRAFDQYQQESAWTWEHQALIKARGLCGDATILRQFTKIRQRILTRIYDSEKLRVDITQMAAKIRENHLQLSTQKQFHLKLSPGGLMDIDFLTQYWVLRFANQDHRLINKTAAMLMIQQLAEYNFISHETATCLLTAQDCYARLLNQCYFEQRPPFVSLDQVGDFPEQIQEIWQQWLN